MYTGARETYDNGSPQEIFDRNISDVEAYNNIFDSVGADCVGLGLPVPRSESRRFTSSVSKIRIRNFIGVAGGRHPLLAVVCHVPETNVAPPFPNAQVNSILIENAEVKGHRFGGGVLGRHEGYDGGSLDEVSRFPPFGIRVLTDGVGSVSDIRIESITAQNFQGNINGVSAVVDVFYQDPTINPVLRPANMNIHFTDCTIGQPPTPDANAAFAYRIFGEDAVNNGENLGLDNFILSPGATISNP